VSERLLVTSALPYANGPVHLGHLVEYIQTDVYVRFRRSIGDDVTWICAADTHGTPIEVNAAKAGMAPGAFAEKFRIEQHQDFQRFGVGFSTFYTTDSEENQKWVYRVYDALKARGLIHKKSVEQLYCQKDQRFLPDRFVKGTCPKCGTPDQYGDVCEKCGTTYDPRDLKEPRCALCGTLPVVRESDQAYVNLRQVEPLIRSWVEADGHLEPAVREQVKGWLADLQDWCITRDPPYFGFPVRDPEFQGKYIYVWLDAPIGYLSSAEHYFADEAPPDRRLSPEAMERTYLAEGAPSRLEHFIGKDILRFHAVFWPVMLWAAGLKLPDRMPVHGHLTVNGEKMSKSRGTFINARTYLDTGLDPQLLRYYYAANLGPGIADLDLSLDEFKNRINADLSNNVANLASRAFALVERAGPPLSERPEERVAGTARSALHLCRGAYLALELREVVRLANQVADLCNKRMQEAKPWEAPSSPASRALLFSVGKALRAIAVMLWPVMPTFADALAEAFGQPRPPVWTKEWDPFEGPPVAARERPPQIARLEAKQLGRLIATPIPATAPATIPTPATAPTGASTATPGVVSYGDFARLDLRVGLVLSAEPVPRADKLLRLSVDLGEGAPRTIAAGIAQAYRDPKSLVGQRIVVVANLEPRAIRGITSQGMLLAVGEPPDLRVVTVGDGIAPGTRVR
jgi:methionyl-tRNA synthetase